MMLGKLLPFLRLCRENEIRHVARQQAERTVVALGAAPAIEARCRVAVWPRRLAEASRRFCAGVGAVLQQPTFDRVFQRALRHLDAHAASSRTSILPVTAAEIRAM